MRPRQQIGERITPPRENRRNSGYLQVAFQVLALGVGCNRLVGCNESRGQCGIVTKVAINQEPPAG